jgi:iron complex outermembrane recepter protein
MSPRVHGERWSYIQVSAQLLIDSGVVRRPLQSLLFASVASLVCLPLPVRAATDAGESPDDLSVIVVSATRTAERSLDLPVAIDRVDRQQIQQGQLEENLSESLSAVPGASVEMRQNYAQDLQISVRGFGARSSFGVRGVRLYADGIPGTMPDGQGQFSQFDLGSADHIELLRGPFSALYGNSSGGVISLYSEEGPAGSAVTATAAWGDYDQHRYALKAAGTAAELNYLVDVVHFDTDGYRDHSAAERNNFNSKLRLDLPDGAQLTLIANMVETPFVEDPLGLTKAQLAADPRQAGTNAITYDTRKDLSQEQVGLIYQHELLADLDLTATLYGGHRSTIQFQAIPASTETNALNPGGVIDLGRGFGGADVHASNALTVAGRPLLLTAGVSYDDLDEARKGFLNFLGAVDGVEGALRRDQSNRVFDMDEYLQAQWDPATRWRLIAGVRHSLVDVSSDDHLAAPGSYPISAAHFEATDPVAGVTFHALPDLSLYAAYGRGFETPTLNDLAYRSVNGDPPGLNIGLKAARSDNYEVGLKTSGTHLSADLSGFFIDTHDELAVEQSLYGRAVDQNIPETQRRGAEVGLTGLWGPLFTTRVAYTWIRAEVAQPYQTCATPPCMNAGADKTVAAGSRLPAVPENALYGAVTWNPHRWGFTTTLEAIGRAQIYANDINTAAASGYWVENFKAGLSQSQPQWSLSEYLRLDNLANRRYVGSVIVNESNGRYFEPEPGRSVYLMLTVTYR